jgi:CRISPR-associated endonuclease Csn1
LTEQLIWAFDVGSRSVGWAVMKGDENGKPTGEVVDAGVVIHSGGVLDDSTGTTRHAVRGAVVRNRRRLKRKKKRRRSLKDELAVSGFELQPAWRQRNPWWARSVLASGPIEDPARVRHLVATALPHMSKHRGWRNPWLKAPRALEREDLDRLKEAAQYLTDQTGKPVPATLGAICWSLMALPGNTKVRRSSKPAGDGERNLTEWIPKVLQAHIAAELQEIWRVQATAHPTLFTNESLERISKTVLFQKRPGVPLDRIGRCAFDDRHYRAPKASPLFQRFRLLDLAANLRTELPDGERSFLSHEQRELVVDLLSRGEQVQWLDLEEVLDLNDGKLVHADREGTAGRPPIDVVAERFKSVKGVSKLREWWDGADAWKREALIAMALSDQSFEYEDEDTYLEVAAEIEDKGLLELVEKFGRALPPGRSPYCRQVLNDLSQQMEGGVDLHEAIAKTYGHGSAEALVKWDDPVPNNGVELSMREVRRVVERLEREYGTPAVIGVEVVREATMSHADRLEHNRRNQRQRDAREETRQLLMSDLGVDKPSAGIIAKQEHITAQTGICLYCETKLFLPSTELDHIVPRRTGGATIFNNLAAVCPDCNSKKGKRPFGKWCEDDGPVGEQRMEETLARLDNLTGPRWKATPAKPFINPETGRWVYSELDLARRDYRRRLKKKDWDREFDDAEIHSTAFVSRAITSRLKTRYPDTRVDVFRGGFTAALRNETKLPSRLGLGTRKDRSDRRHHAMDAIAVALLTNATWAARVRRRNEAFQNKRVGLMSDERFDEVREGAPIEDLLATVDSVETTGKPIIEVLVPVLPRRLSTTGRIHEDTVRPWSSKRVGEAWSATEISSVRDRETANALWRLTGAGGKLKEDAARALNLPDGETLDGDAEITCAIKHDPESGRATAVATWLPVRHGWAKTDEIHHARLITARWNENGKSKEMGILVPLSIADVYGSAHPFDVPISSDMTAARAHPKLARILAFDPEAQLEPLGSLTQGDVVIDAGRRWVVTTFDSTNNRAEVRSALLGGPALGKQKHAFTARALTALRGTGLGSADDVGT